MTMTITIELGNDAMKTGEDVAGLLEKLAADYRDWYGCDDVQPLASALFDLNGARVGGVGFSDPLPDEPDREADN